MRLSNILRGLIPLRIEVMTQKDEVKPLFLLPGDSYIITSGESKIRLNYHWTGLEVLLASPEAVRHNWKGLGNNDKEEVKSEKTYPVRS